MVYLIIWVLFGMATAIAARNKGRNPGAWFLLGMLLGPFGLLFALLAGPVESKPEKVREEELRDLDAAWTRGDVPTDEYRKRRVALLVPDRKCPHCAEMIKAEASVCRFCGREVPPDPRIAAAAAAVDAVATAKADADRQRSVKWERRGRRLRQLFGR